MQSARACGAAARQPSHLIMSEGWCERGDSNPHVLANASPSSWCVCQFRHFREVGWCCVLARAESRTLIVPAVRVSRKSRLRLSPRGADRHEPKTRMDCPRAVWDLPNRGKHRRSRSAPASAGVHWGLQRLLGIRVSTLGRRSRVEPLRDLLGEIDSRVMPQ